MISSQPAPYDPQNLVNQYFEDKEARAGGNRSAGVVDGKRKRLVVTEGTLSYRVLSKPETIKAFFGFGPAAFKKVVKFCGDKGIEHEKLAITVLQYNSAHHLGCKKVQSLFLQTVSQELPAQNQLDARDVEGRTALHRAAESLDQHETLTELLLKGADVNSRDKNGVTPFMEACIVGDTTAAECLRLAGANVRTRDHEGNTALHYHAAEDDVSAEMIRYLLEHGADIHAKNKMGRTALHDACQGFSPAASKLLIEAGAKLEVKDKDGMTPLMIACINNRDETVKMLLEKGAEIENKDALIALARSYKAMQVVDLLK